MILSGRDAFFGGLRLSGSDPINKTGIIVQATYEQPRFTLNGAGVAIMEINNGSIAITGLQNGRSPV